MFTGRNNQDVFNKILSHDIDFLDGIDEDAEDLIKQLCSSNPKHRIGLKNIEMLKEHKFFQGIDWQKLDQQEADIPDFEMSVNENGTTYMNT